MAGIKRKEAPKAAATHTSLPQKKQKTVKSAAPKTSKRKAVPVEEDFPESDTTEDDDDDELDQLSSPAGGASIESAGSVSDIDSDEEMGAAVPVKKDHAKSEADGYQKPKSSTTSAEAHATQRALAKERKANKPNADSIQRSKKIWERLRRKSHVPLDERKALVAELFDIINGRVREFVFKHDSVRVIQCALKYANKEQRRSIVKELQTDLRSLAESKYGKFLVGKMIVEGDQAVRDMIIPEFYGHVRRLINHPEAAWIMDDIYRQVASPTQKALLLREWYGAEFAVFGKSRTGGAQDADKDVSADLTKLLTDSPEKKKTIMNYLQQLINQLVQKKMTGFTMLHDAMLQYFLNTTPGSEEASEFLELLKSDLDEESGGDLLKNLAFTKSGSRVVSLALAYGSAKDRKIIIRAYKDTMEMMALDANAHVVLMAAMDVTDDTKMSAKMLFPELLGENIKDESEREERLMGLATSLTARLPLLYPLAGLAKWLVNDADKTRLEEVHVVRETTSKKNADTRRAELVQYVSPTLLALVAHRAQDLSASSFGCQCMSEILLECQGDKTAACAAVAALAEGDVKDEAHIVHSPAHGKMLRALVQGGRFDPETKTIRPVEPALGFAAVLFGVIREQVLEWACGPSSFVVVALLESADLDEAQKKDLAAALKKGKKKLEKAAAGEAAPKKPEAAGDGEAAGKKKKSKVEKPRGNAGAKILLQKLGV